jgi:hypothetical protein
MSMRTTLALPRVRPLLMTMLAATLPALSGCGDTATIVQPKPVDTPAVCDDPSCQFRKLDMTELVEPLSAAAALSRTSLEDAAAGQALATRIDAVLSGVKAGQAAAANRDLLLALSQLDALMSNPRFAGDVADLSAIRLNLEPAVVRLQSG